MTYKSYTLRNYREIPELQALGEDTLFDIEAVARVFPFKTNNYVLERLVDWDDIPGDPMYVLNIPQRGMLQADHYERMAGLMRAGAPEDALTRAANEIRMALNPHPSSQMDRNVPRLGGELLDGMQHKYPETVLFFPSQGQTCHAYCTFCFRWPQFVGIEDLRFSTREIELLVEYVNARPGITDILLTGGDPLVMRSERLAAYLDVIVREARHITNIRIGTKAISYWPYRFTRDEDSGGLLEAFERVVASGRHLALMAHFNHPRELSTGAAREAIKAIQRTGAVIRTQSPVLRHINDDAGVWIEMWREQVRLGLVPYYMFVVRDTGAQHFFGVPLVEAHRIFSEARRSVSGLGRTGRGPSMSADPGKIMVVGDAEVGEGRVLVLSMLQGRRPEWVWRVFLAEYDEQAMWLDDLRPAFGAERFFFDEEGVRRDEPMSL